jgi:hypothetical protein
MSRFGIILCSVMCLAAFPLIAEEWRFSQHTDPFTDEVITIYSKSSLVVRCGGRDLDVYIKYNDFLSNSDVDVKYRFDKDKPIKSIWSISTEGTSVFATEREVGDFFRAVTKSEELSFAVYDYRETSHLKIIDLSGSKVKNFDEIGKQCRVARDLSPAFLESKDKVTEYQVKVIGKWGPKSVHCKKQVLANLGYLDKERINEKKDEHLYVAIAEMNADFPKICDESGASSFCPERVNDASYELYAIGLASVTDKNQFKEKCGHLQQGRQYE